jgi:hypothetical protein
MGSKAVTLQPTFVFTLKRTLNRRNQGSGSLTGRKSWLMAMGAVAEDSHRLENFE